MTLNESQTKFEHPTFVILGSGGHTAEMCKIIKALNLQTNQSDVALYQPCYYLVASTDTTSRRKVLDAMSGLNNDSKASFIDVPRSRHVGQSWFTTIFTTLWALLFSFWLVWRYRPKLVLCNGPGTCVPFCFAAYICRMLRRLPATSKIVFVESFCRVQSLSLSGKLLKPIVDSLVVQWLPLAKKYAQVDNVRYFSELM